MLMIDGPREPRPTPDFEAQNRLDPTFPQYDIRVLRGADQLPDFAVLTSRELAALSAAYHLEAIACRAQAARPDARPFGIRAAIWVDKWNCDALAARMAAQCCETRLKARRTRRRK